MISLKFFFSIVFVACALPSCNLAEKRNNLQSQRLNSSLLNSKMAKKSVFVYPPESSDTNRSIEQTNIPNLGEFDSSKAVSTSSVNEEVKETSLVKFPLIGSDSISIKIRALETRIENLENNFNSMETGIKTDILQATTGVKTDIDKLGKRFDKLETGIKDIGKATKNLEIYNENLGDVLRHLDKVMNDLEVLKSNQHTAPKSPQKVKGEDSKVTP